jgi:septum formation protein
MGIEHQVAKFDFDETIPQSIKPEDSSLYIAESKARQINPKKENTIYITSDTVVISENQILGKPSDESEAFKMLTSLSGKKHLVITGVCISDENTSKSFKCESVVYFKDLSKDEITYYIKNYKPFDKAGAYGIQEWIGMIGVEKIEGSYFNIMGLPSDRLFVELNKFIKHQNP